MLSIISPAKTMDFSNSDDSGELCNFLPETNILLDELKAFSITRLRSIIETSEKLSKLNFDRYQNFDSLPSKPAIYAYNGDVYSKIDRTFSKDQINFLKKHVGIISGLYGLLGPMDKIRPYRLEMRARLPISAQNGLSVFWQKTITESLKDKISKHKNKILINLASKEYSKAIDRKNLRVPVVDIHFMENRGDVLKNIPINAKRARGMMLNYIIKNEIDDLDGLKKFNANGYEFSSSNSTESNFFFLK